MDRAKLHVYVPTQLFIIIPTTFDKLAVPLSDSARGNFSGAIANAIYFEKYRRRRYRFNFVKLAALPLPVVIWKLSGATVIPSTLFSDR